VFGFARLLVGGAVLCLTSLGCAASAASSSFCGALLANAKLVYPASDAVSVDPNVGVIILSGASDRDTIRLLAPAGSVVAGPLGLPPSPLPSGVPPPPPGITAASIYEAASLPRLVQSTRYSVNVSQPNGVDCGNARTYGLGSVTTR
jgi:hypothetical protein